MLHQDAHCNTAGGDYIASPVDQPVHGQQGSGDGPYIISGRKGCGMHPRLNVCDLANKAELKEQWTLFILAYLEIQRPDYEPKAAQFGKLGGIHGLPYERWIGDPEGTDWLAKGSKWGGYCNHRSILFPTWHRPCIMATEQALGEAAVSIVHERFNLSVDNPDRNTWLKAAEELRFPFWDWTDPLTEVEGLPKIFIYPQVEIHPPASSSIPQIVDNPMACYKFGNKLPDGFRDTVDRGRGSAGFAPEEVGSNEGTVVGWGFGDEDKMEGRLRDTYDENGQCGMGTNAYFSKWNRTYRWPQSVVRDPIEDYDGLNRELKKRARVMRAQVAMLFSFPENVGDRSVIAGIWDEFSNVRFQSGFDWPSQFSAGSLEGPHDTMHIILGGNGSMADPDYAGFDPIFYLHHANVDRIYSLWEYVYPDYWMGESGYDDPKGKKKAFTQEDGTWMQTNEGASDENTPLAPFRKSKEGYWSSNDVRFLGECADIPKYYTYSPTAGVSVHKKQSTHIERSECLSALQAYFGLDDLITPVDIVTGNWEPRAFAIAVEFSPPTSATSSTRSFSLDVHFIHPLTQARIFVGCVSSFRRAPETQCSACIKRREDGEGMKIRGIIPLPAEIVEEVMLQLESPRYHSGGRVRVEVEDVGAVLMSSFLISVTTVGDFHNRSLDAPPCELPLGQLGALEELSPTITLVSSIAESVNNNADEKNVRYSPKTFAPWAPIITRTCLPQIETDVTNTRADQGARRMQLKKFAPFEGCCPARQGVGDKKDTRAWVIGVCSGKRTQVMRGGIVGGGKTRIRIKSTLMEFVSKAVKPFTRCFGH